MMNKNPVSVVIPCYHQREWDYVVSAVKSVQMQIPAPAQVVVTVDHNPAMFARAARELNGVTVVANEYVRGASGNRNTGVAATDTAVVAMLDGDSLAREGWLRSLSEPFEDPQVVGTGGMIVPVWRGRRPSWFPDEFLWTVGGSFPTPTQAPRPIRNVWSASMAVRRDAFDAVGGFRVGFGKQGSQARPEDTELCIRLAMESGGRWMFVPSAVIEHPVPPERSRFSWFVSRCYQEGRGKVEMARMFAGNAVALDNERAYLSRTLPRAIGRGLSAAAGGQGVRHVAVAGAVVLGVAAAAVGGGVEALRAPASAGDSAVGDGGAALSGSVSDGAGALSR